MVAVSDTWAADQAVLALLDDLEQQAEGLHLRSRDFEVAERSVGEYAQVTLMARWHAAIGAKVNVLLSSGGRMSGEVSRTGLDWVLLADDQGGHWLIPNAAVAVVRGLPTRAVAAEAAGVTARLTWRSVIRGLIERRVDCVVHLRIEGETLRGWFTRAGADFCEVLTPDSRSVVVSWEAVAAVRVRSAV